MVLQRKEAALRTLLKHSHLGELILQEAASRTLSLEEQLHQFMRCQTCQDPQPCKDIPIQVPQTAKISGHYLSDSGTESLSSVSISPPEISLTKF